MATNFKSVLGKRYQFDLQYKPFEGSLKRNRIPADQAISVGDIFFNDDPGKARFKLVGILTQEQGDPNSPRRRLIATIEDLSEQKKGAKLELMIGSSITQKRESTQYDHTVVFRFNSPGEEENHFKIMENGFFSLPHGGEEKNFKLIEVKLEDPAPAFRKAVAVVLQYEIDGEAKTREIPFMKLAK